MAEVFARRQGVAVVAIGLCVVAANVHSSVSLPATGRVEVAFSPRDDPQALLTRVIGAARKTIHVQAYVFTSQPIADALIAAHRRGVKVEVLADAGMNRRGTGKALPKLLEAGVPLAFETRYAAAHNKVVIIDPQGPGCALVTGSYNFTWSARNRNAENIVVHHDNCALARHFLDNWRVHRKDAEVVKRLPQRP